ncbi:hypothetical protein [Ammoniphilus sp. CFH 90114]|uniref:hypothetical protein n=1 Tax=Ammoniphilus sp. CFH 90114 TaxID=2493665 RepID=UPI00100F8A87|nr:hypothetical protein [Ammoniphilus sp. CFH 90114]RXT08110.1 hypothetical protein EIZ39_11935 [Ammoniphilus sp. CFH 90114]
MLEDRPIIFSIDPGEHIGYAASSGNKVLEAGVIVGVTEHERFSTLNEKICTILPHIILIENSYKYKKKITHMLKTIPEGRRPVIYLLDAKQVQFRLFGKPFGKYGKEKTSHRQIRNLMVQEYFGMTYEVHANDALLMIIDWNKSPAIVSR